MSKLKLGIPKGSLQDATVELFAQGRLAHFRELAQLLSGHRRSGNRMHDGARAGNGAVRGKRRARRGLTGKDWILETGADVEEVAELVYSKTSLGRVRWVLAVAEDSPMQSVKDLEGKVIATEAVQMTEKYLAKHGVKARVEFSWGATEVKVPQLADAIVEVTETGSSLRANQLRVVDTLLESATWLIANRGALQGSLEARKNREHGAAAGWRDQGVQPRGLDAERAQAKIWKKCWRALPALRNPTISQLSDAGLGGDQHDRGGKNRAAADSQAEGGARGGDRGISAEQGRVLMMRIVLAYECEPQRKVLGSRRAGSRDAERVAARIVADVRRRGDRALFAWTKRLDRVALEPRSVWVSRAEIGGGAARRVARVSGGGRPRGAKYSRRGPSGRSRRNGRLRLSRECARGSACARSNRWDAICRAGGFRWFPLC